MFRSLNGVVLRLAWLTDLVFPSFLPDEILLDEIFQRDAADEVVQAPPGADMTDDQDPPRWDNWPGSQPVARPCSLSTVVEWVSKTSSIATSQPYGRRAATHWTREKDRPLRLSDHGR